MRTTSFLSDAVASRGRRRARRGLISAVALGLLLTASPAAASTDTARHDITVREQDGVYRVEARFLVPQAGPLVVAVLTDYEQIPRFMPDVRTSTVLERGNRRTVVEQEAVARVMMFSKRVHLVLEVQEEAATIHFRDRCGKSFSRYEGSWSITEHHTGAEIVYQLTAKPAFDVPTFLLRRLLKRDAQLMIERLRTEISARSRLRQGYGGQAR